MVAVFGLHDAGLWPTVAFRRQHTVRRVQGSAPDVIRRLSIRKPVEWVRCFALFISETPWRCVFCVIDGQAKAICAPIAVELT